jgi:choline-phosphate cytidylyltransferase
MTDDQEDNNDLNNNETLLVDTVITFGTFDLLHIGHVRLLQRARALGRRLVVGVSSDALNVAKKGRAPIYSLHDRMAMLAALRCVDEVFVEESLEDKPAYVRAHHAQLLVMGDDWLGKFDASLQGICAVQCVPRTPSISTTEVIEIIRDQ